MNLLKIIGHIVFLCAMASANAGPGAHGPNGEHLDGPATGQANSAAQPRIETFTETFELVGQLSQNQLSIFIDRYDSNQPVLNGKLEIELNGVKADAKFHADLGNYVVNDPKILKVLAKPGKHALLFTITDGSENDLLEAHLEVTAAQATGHETAHGADHRADHHHPHPFTAKNIWIVLIAFAAIAIGLFTTARRRQARGKLS